jgi:ketosteroid isomerase-like protein
MREADIEKLMAVWAEDEEVVCVPPGGMRLFGAVAVRAAFTAIFSGGTLSVHAERVRHVQGLACAVHSVMERIEFSTTDGRRTAWVLATNVYLKTAMGWRLVSHHASPAIAEPPSEVVELPAVFH